MEQNDNIDTFMAEILGIENEYDVLNKQAKVCTYNKITNLRLYHHTDVLVFNNSNFIYIFQSSF